MLQDSPIQLCPRVMTKSSTAYHFVKCHVRTTRHLKQSALALRFGSMQTEVIF
jgi:hypothetical protein